MQHKLSVFFIILLTIVGCSINPNPRVWVQSPAAELSVKKPLTEQRTTSEVEFTLATDESYEFMMGCGGKLNLKLCPHFERNIKSKRLNIVEATCLSSAECILIPKAPGLARLVSYSSPETSLKLVLQDPEVDTSAGQYCLEVPWRDVIAGVARYKVENLKCENTKLN